MNTHVKRLARAVILAPLVFVASPGPSPVQGQSGPSFDCTAARQNVERAICDSTELSRFDREMRTLYRDRLDALPDDQHRSFIHGGRAWLIERDVTCDEGSHANIECIRDSYVRRMDALRRIGSTRVRSKSPFETVGGTVWLQIKSESSRRKAINRAWEYGHLVDHFSDTKVFLASNGWYAIALGPFEPTVARGISATLADAGPNLDGDHYANRGKGYINLVYSAQTNLSYAYATRQPIPIVTPSVPRDIDDVAMAAPTPPPSAPPAKRRKPPEPVSAPRVTGGSTTPSSMLSDGSRGATCRPESVRERQALCYVLAVGEHACAEGLEEVTGVDGGYSFLGEAAISASCTAAVAGLSNGSLTPGMLVTSAFIGGVDAWGESLTRDDSLVANIFGLALRASALAGKVQLAANCARLEASNCDY